MISALVMVHLSVWNSYRRWLTAPFSAKGSSEPLDQALVQRIDLTVRQRSILGAIGNFIGQTLFTFRNRRAQILVEYFHMLDQSVAEIVDPSNDLLTGKVAVDDDRDIPLYSWKSRQRMSGDLPRSILKQFLEVKFEQPTRWHFEPLTDIGMKLAQVSHRRVF